MVLWFVDLEFSKRGRKVWVGYLLWVTGLVSRGCRYFTFYYLWRGFRSSFLGSFSEF